MLTVAIPTLDREQVLIETLRHLLAQQPPAAEILVLDQSIRHEHATDEALATWQRTGCIRWLRLSEPSVTKAMNQGLLAANCAVVLFVDDDVMPGPDLVAAHFAAHERGGAGLVAGRIIQPWEEGQDLSQTGSFRFAQDRPAWIGEFMGGNFSIERDLALALGGFDENFVRVAYRFEGEFAHRLRLAGHRIYFEPTACIHHLKAGSGGTRTFGDHLRSYRPSHSVGAYYYHLRTWSGWRSLAAILSRPLRAIANRHHLRFPWWIPATVTAELLGLIWAIALALRGARYVGQRTTRSAAPRPTVLHG